MDFFLLLTGCHKKELYNNGIKIPKQVQLAGAYLIVCSSEFTDASPMAGACLQ